ncbi:MAG TPA: S8 family serine peptidase [Stellaceae bacterium]|nr:S8 family serine peptidase [Stellaceae bacterium]
MASQNLDCTGDGAAVSTQSAGTDNSVSGGFVIVATTPPEGMTDGLIPSPGASGMTATDPVGTGVAQAVDAAAAEAQFGVTGAGVKIGILSDSFNALGGAAQDEADGALPASGVTVLAEGPAGSTDEGRAMAEIVHSIAPGAQLLFATADGGEQAFANNITALVNAGAKIIVDDFTYFAEPFFQDGGPIDQAIEAAEAKGVQFFTSAGNEASNFLEGNFNPITTTLPGSAQQVVAENFGNGIALQRITLGANTNIVFDLQWAQPFGSFGTGQSAQNSLALEFFDPSNGNSLVVSTGSNDVVGGDPVQVVGITNTSDTPVDIDVAIVENGGTTPTGQLFKLIAIGDGQPVTIDSASAGIGSGTVFGHHEIPAEDAVGAVDFTNTPAFGVNPAQIEPFSSAGPGEILFGNNGLPLASPEDPGQVDFAAPNGEATCLPADSGLNPFFGTSAAAPVAAAIAALVDQEDPALTFQQVTNILKESSLPMPQDPAAAVGAGLIQADTAVALAQSLSPDAATTIGTGTNFFDDGESDRFQRLDATGQLQVVPQNGSPLPLTANGSPVTISSSTAVIGAGEDFFGSGDGRAIFLLSQGQLSALEFNPSTGIEQAALSFTNWADSAGTTVIGAGEDYLRGGQRDVFQRLSSGQLEMGQFNSSGAADYALFFTNWAVDPTTTVIGAGEDFLGSGEQDVFFHLSDGQLELGEFNSSGVADYALFFTNWAIDSETTVIGAGEDYLGSGERDVFQRLGTGQLEMGQFNGSGVADYALFFTNWGVDTGTTVIGAGEDLLRSGQRDIFFRVSSGQLEMGQFTSSGQADAALFFTNSDGSAFTVDTGTRVVGVGVDSRNNLSEVTLQLGSGAIETFDLSNTRLTSTSAGASLGSTTNSSITAALQGANGVVTSDMSNNSLAGGSIESQVSQLTQAMAAFAPLSGGVGFGAPGQISDTVFSQIGVASTHRT